MPATNTIIATSFVKRLAILFSSGAYVIGNEHKLSVALVITEILLVAGFFTVQPNESKVLTLFGAYTGTVRQSGFCWANPFQWKRAVSLRLHNLKPGRYELKIDGQSIGTFADSQLAFRLELEANPNYWHPDAQYQPGIKKLVLRVVPEVVIYVALAAWLATIMGLALHIVRNTRASLVSGAGLRQRPVIE